MATTNYSFQTIDETKPVYPNGIDDLNLSLSQIDNKIKELDDQNIKKSTVTTKGDLIVGTGNATVTRLGIGTEGQVLKSDATGTPVWGDLPPVMILSGDVLPVADETYRGKLFLLEGDTEVADVLHICIKDDTDSYVWKALSFINE
jgi:hypothetical protein